MRIETKVKYKLMAWEDNPHCILSYSENLSHEEIMAIKRQLEQGGWNTKLERKTIIELAEEIKE